MEQIKKNAEAVGKCGNDLYGYYLDGTLYIEGTGDFADHEGPVRNSQQHPGMKVTLKSQVKQIVIAEGCRRIKRNALSEYINLESIIIPASVRRIDPAVFMQCAELKSIEVDDDNPSYTTLEGVLFSKKKRTLVTCPRMKTGDYILPAAVKKIAPYAFYGCGALTAIQLPEGLRKIGETAFGFCSQILSIAIPKQVARIPGSAFSCCSKLTTVNLPEGIMEIGGGAFESCAALSSVIIPAGVAEIEPAVFSDCTGLISVDIPYGVTKIGNSAFFRCRNLRSCNIPDGVTEIGHRAFYGCEQLSEIRLPDGLQVIKWAAFSCCYGIKLLEIPESVTTIEYDAFFKVPHIVYYGTAKAGDGWWGALHRN